MELLLYPEIDTISPDPFNTLRQALIGLVDYFYLWTCCTDGVSCSGGGQGDGPKPVTKRKGTQDRNRDIKDKSRRRPQPSKPPRQK